MEENRELKKERDRDKQKAAGGQIDQIMDQVEKINDISVLAAKVQVDDPKALRELGDRVKDRLSSGVIALGAENKGKALLLVIVTPGPTGQISRRQHNQGHVPRGGRRRRRPAGHGPGRRTPAGKPGQSPGQGPGAGGGLRGPRPVKYLRGPSWDRAV